MYVSGYVGATLMVSSTEITSFAKVKTFTICPFTEKVCGPVPREQHCFLLEAWKRNRIEL